MLYACGSNGSGQLGLGHYEDVDHWNLVEIGLSGPIKAVGGGNHTVIIEIESGSAWATQDAMFTRIHHPLERSWVNASAGWDFIILVDDSNQVWCQGTGLNGELGLGGATEAKELTKLSWISPNRIVQIDSGVRHTVLLTDKGELYGWGASRKGQCGHVQRTVLEPTLFDMNDSDQPVVDRVVKIACGRDFTVSLKKSGRLDVWGDKKKFLKDDLDTLMYDSQSSLLAGWSNFLIGDRLFGSTSHNQLSSPQSNTTFQALGSEHSLQINGSTVTTSGWGEHGNCPPATDFSGKIQVFGGCATSFVYTTP